MSSSNGDGTDVVGRRRPRSSTNPPKRKYLLTDEGFLPALLVNLFIMVTTVIGIALHQSSREYVVNAYFSINEKMMAIANRNAWWALLGLLSSSCCALQIILNAASFGCSGVNAFLGPMRPTFVSFAILSIGISWVVAWPRPYQWKPTALSTGLSLLLTLMPEFINLRTQRRAQRRRLRELDEGKLDDLVLHPDGKRTEPTTLYFHLPTLGCASCVSTVSGLLDRLEIVVNHRVHFEDGVVQVEIAPDTQSNANDDLLWHQISSELADAGFPAKRIDVKERKKDR